MKWCSETLLEATKGTLFGHKNWATSSVSIDTRTITPGDLFIAIKGKNFDGHDFVHEAFEKGAIAAIVHTTFKTTKSIIVVKDTLQSIHDMAKYVRKKSYATIFIGITGSIGKTTTKEILSIALAPHGKVYVNHGNFNNHIGLPLSMIRMPEDTQYAVFEMAMNHKGEIALLSKILCPNIAMITNVHSAHIGNFVSMDELAVAKGEIFIGLQKNGIAILNHDNKYYQFFLHRLSNIKTISFGRNSAATVRLLSSNEDIVVYVNKRYIKYKLSILDQRLVYNSVAALTVVHAMNLELILSAQNLYKFQPLAGRGKIYHDVAIKDDLTITLIDESYNANPIAVQSALQFLGSFQGRTISILGDMLELGTYSKYYHHELLHSIIANDIKLVYTIGEHMAELYKHLPTVKRGMHCSNVNEFMTKTMEFIDRDIVLIKGSFSMQMSKIVASLIQSSINLKKIM